MDAGLLKGFGLGEQTNSGMGSSSFVHPANGLDVSETICHDSA
jgi:hypothetical protein